MVTAAAVAHANRLSVLLLPADVFAGRRPDPVLQQVEAFGDPTISVNDCFSIAASVKLALIIHAVTVLRFGY